MHGGSDLPGAKVFACLRDEDGEQISASVDLIGEPFGYGVIFEVERVGYIARAKHYSYVAPISVLSMASHSSLFEAFRDAGITDQALYVTREAPEDFDPEESDVEDGYHFECREDQVVAVIDTRFRNESSVPERLDSLVRSVTHRAGIALVAIEPAVELAGDAFSLDWIDAVTKDSGEAGRLRAEHVNSYRGLPRTYRVELGAIGTDAALASLIAAARNIVALMQVMRGRGEVDVAAVRAWLRDGRFDLLLGLTENAWFEIKSQAYSVLPPAPADVQVRQKFELAQDVARFANSDVDAVLVLGYKEVRKDRESVADSMTPIALEQLSEERYRSILDERVVPAIDGLEIEVFETEPGRGIMMISIPRQPSEMQPYLVHGTIVGDKVEGAFFSIVRRRGEASITTKASQIHGYIVAGRNGLARPYDATLE